MGDGLCAGVLGRTVYVHVRSVAGLAGVKERIMGSSEKKRAREQSAAARRERAVKRRMEKSAVPSGADGSSWTVRVGIPAQIPDAAPPGQKERGDE
jgi:hypothetical protein